MAFPTTDLRNSVTPPTSHVLTLFPFEENGHSEKQIIEILRLHQAGALC